MQGDKKEDGEKRRNPKHFRFLQGGAQTLNSNRSLDYARDNESIIYFNVYATQQKYTSMLVCYRKKHPFTSYSSAKHPKHSKIAITNMRKKPKNI